MITKLYNFLESIHETYFFLFIFRVFKVFLNLFYNIYFYIIFRNRYGKESNVIISLTSFPNRIKGIDITVKTLLNQTVKPKKILLYLSKDQFKNINTLPKKLLRLQNEIFEIKMVDEDLKPHKKYFYSMLEYPNNPILTVDDDIFYPENLLEGLESASILHGHVICCVLAHQITLTKNNVNPYNDWVKNSMVLNKARFDLLAVGCCGVLYPPHTFSYDILLNKDDIKELCLYADDLWLKANSIMSNIKTIRIDLYKYNIFIDRIINRNVKLNSMNVDNNGNDAQFNKILQKYPNIVETLIKEKNVIFKESS